MRDPSPEAKAHKIFTGFDEAGNPKFEPSSVVIRDAATNAEFIRVLDEANVAAMRLHNLTLALLSRDAMWKHTRAANA